MRFGRLDGEFDLNVRVDAAAGSSVLKVADESTDPGLVSLRAGALTHLGGRVGEIAIPVVLPTRTGEPWTELAVDGARRRVWRVSWLEGRSFLDVRPRRPALLRHLGSTLARLDAALEGYDHPLLDRDHPWDPARAGWLADALPALEEGADREIVAAVVARWPDLERRLRGLPEAVIHGDANDHNLFVEDVADPRRIVGIFDFGDMMRSRRVCEIAIASAYAAFGARDVVGAIAEAVAGYHGVTPLLDDEIAVIGDLVRTRLSISVVMAARRRVERPDDAYVTVSQAPAWTALRALGALDSRWVTARFRDACGRPPFPSGSRVKAWLEGRAQAGLMAPILDRPLHGDHVLRLDLGLGSPMLGADPEALETGPLSHRIDESLERAGAAVGIGLWDEGRAMYRSPPFADGDHPLDEHRTIHFGVDLFVPAGTALHAPIDGVIEAITENTAPKDYGPVLLMRHEPEDAPAFWTLWGHLDPYVATRWKIGDVVAAGDTVALVGAPPRNGDWPPHLHLQLVLDPLGRGADVPGVAPDRERSTWRAWSPDPSALCGLPPGAVAARTPDVEGLVERRRGRLGTGLSLSYGRPLHLVRGWRQYLYDPAGRAYLDLYNNVPHVGHSHPAVAEAVARQISLLNTNTRYLHEAILEYADALASRLPSSLEAVWIVNSASEANELALRLARAATGRREVVVQESGYHGHTTALIAVSPYKFDGPGGEGRVEWVETVPVPDDYRGRHRREQGDAGLHYGDEVARTVARMLRDGRPPGAFLAETCPSVGGQIMPPDGYLERAYGAVRSAGGLCIADEVQTGFGRLGDVFWGFESYGVVPDIVVLGKPAGNGMALAAVVATREVADAFDTGMEFFSTFGGNPVSCAAGLAVLDVLEREGLQDRAARVGGRLIGSLRELAHGAPLLGDVRGRGLFIGVDCVQTRGGREAAPLQARYVVERLREAGILAGTDGPDHNVIKLRGPLTLDESDVDRTIAVLEGVLAERGAQPSP